MAKPGPLSSIQGSTWWLVVIIFSSIPHLIKSQNSRPTCFSSIDLLIVVDSSGSVPFLSPFNWGMTKNLTKNYIDTLDVSRDMVRIALVQVADNAEVRFHLNTYSNPEEMKREIDNLQVFNQGMTNLAAAFEKARTEVFTFENGDRPNVLNVLLFISDGQPTLRIAETIPEADRLKREKEVIIVPFGISGRAVNIELLQQISTAGSANIVSFDDFDLTKNLLMEQKLDICLIVDASGSINFLDPNNWFYAKFFLKTLVSQLQVQTDGIRVGCVTFNSSAEVHFNLGQYNDVNGVLEAIDRLPYYGGRTNLAAGLRMARTKVFELTGKFRTDRKSVAVVITDGVPTDEKNLTQIEADNLKRGGVHLVSVVVQGNAQIDMSVLRNIASYSPTGSDRTRRAVVQVTDYRALTVSTATVLERICLDSGQQPPPPVDPDVLVCYNSCNPPSNPRGLPRGRYQYCDSGVESVPADCNKYLICRGPGNNNGNNNGNNVFYCGQDLFFDVAAQTCSWKTCTCPGRRRSCQYDTGT